MQLLTGAAGSGKTYTILAALRAALARGDSEVRLLVPTATMAQHLRDMLAREGLVFPPGVIQTLSRFVEHWAAGLPQVSEPVLQTLVEQTVRRLNLSEFSKSAHLVGFHTRLAAVFSECAAAGCDAGSLKVCQPRSGLSEAVVQVFEETRRALEDRNLGMRDTRLRVAAEGIRQAGCGSIHTVWMDGFFSLTGPEIAVVQALAGRAEVAITLPSAAIAEGTRARLLAMGFKEQVLTRSRSLPRREVFAAPSIEREADEIARRILAEAAAGRPFREIGIIVRTPETYVALLRGTLERFAIPARSYFDSVLMEQPAIRFLTGVLDAMLDGWDHAQTLTATKLAPGLGVSAAMDRFDFALREKLPGAGLEPLRQLAGTTNAARLSRLLDRFAELDAWRALSLKPAQWSQQFARLRALYRPSQPRDGVSQETVLEWRSESAALDTFDAAVEAAAQSLEPESKIPLSSFWEAVKMALRLTPLRVPDRRRNVVHVLSVYEARQWELPVVFVCGLVEGQFPRYYTPDPFLPDAVRRQLNERGIRIRTAEDQETEEQFLFDSAVCRATTSVTLSYPRNDVRGEQNLPSLFLDPAEPVRSTQPVRAQAPRPAGVPSRNGIRSADLLQILTEKHKTVKPTALESFLQCPFQFFGRHTLKLEGAPDRPEQRLDFLARGIIVHGVVAEWLKSHGDITAVFERVFREEAEAKSIPVTYGTELLRARMLQDLRRFAETDRWPAECRSETEISAEYQLDGELAIRCRIDRLIQTGDGRAFVIDYKYSRDVQERVTNHNLLQGPLYWLAAERAFGLQTAAMFYCGLRDAVQYAGWGEAPDWLGPALAELPPPDWLDTAITRSIDSARDILGGRIAPRPSDVSLCRRCDFRDVCRYQSGAAAIAEGAS